ncbi:hypothetical protein [Acanthopleuribacter pedis]|uniref:Uncharacterized protein n=1 Tax=Acanthopleuribacter pedis TaxID=442870 RepID=A0A8J7QKE9_9BACT|nr:hypothetical protein [Acanthopleuribacter pedis]MBO1322631.1 hypothetical protein [Acanthopleuribacter pedis]
MELDDQMKSLLKELGVALHHALTKDQTIKNVTDQIKGNGYDIYLIMEANIALDKRDEEDGEGVLYLGKPEERYEAADQNFNHYDKEFLAALKIKIEDSGDDHESFELDIEDEE